MRESGLLIHPSCLPGPGPIGTLGADARMLIDQLAQAGQSLWQILPLGPTGYGHSPYMATSALGGNPNLIDLDTLHAQGWLSDDELAATRVPAADFIDPDHAVALVSRALKQAWARFGATASADDRAALAAFAEREAAWLDDFALFHALDEAWPDCSWTDWPEGARDRDEDTLAALREEHADTIDRYRFEQWVFRTQWDALHAYANEHGIDIVGDLPIFVSHHSVDVWSNRPLFDLKANGEPWNVSGVPPDYFSPTGQRWGNPLYRWDRMHASGYAWWIERFRGCFALVDRVRVDHFRGFQAYWEIPAHEETAINGRWRRGPGRALFDAVRAAIGPLPIIAEDLGTITPEVQALRDGLGYPGMKVMHFATGNDRDNPHKEHNHGINAVVYSGTHDNNTTIGWYRELDEMGRHEVRTWLSTDGAHVALAMIDRTWASSARIAVAPMQDVLELGGGARMNTPGTVEGNWIWRMRPGAFSTSRRLWLRQVTQRRDRLGRHGHH